VGPHRFSETDEAGRRSGRPYRPRPFYWVNSEPSLPTWSAFLWDPEGRLSEEMSLSSPSFEAGAPAAIVPLVLAGLLFVLDHQARSIYSSAMRIGVIHSLGVPPAFLCLISQMGRERSDMGTLIKRHHLTEKKQGPTCIGLLACEASWGSKRQRRQASPRSDY
jgi:hypothetical protein